MNSDLISLKRRWVPLFLFGAAFFGAGIALFLLWQYRRSPLVEVVVGLASAPAGTIPPPGTLISATSALFTAVGGAALLLAIRQINASEVGEIDSFWWKVAVASLAGRWWLGEPRVVLAAGGEALGDLARALRTLTARLAVLVPEGAETADVYRALAEDETALDELWPGLAGLEKSTGALSPVLRLRGQILAARPEPRLFDAIARADAVVIGPGAADILAAPEIAGAVRRARARKIFVAPILGERLSGWLEPLVECVGQPSAVLVNNNVVPEQPGYLRGGGGPREIARDLLDWADPARHDPAKLRVFLREVILR